MNRELLTNIMIGFAIAVLVLGFIMGYVNKKKDSDDEEEPPEEAVVDNAPVYEDDDLDDESSNDDGNSDVDVEEKTQKEQEDEIVEKVKEIEKENEDTSFIEYDTEYETVFSSNEKHDEETVSSAVKIMYEIISLQFKKGGSETEKWQPLVTNSFFETITSGGIDEVVYSDSNVMEVQSVPIESKSGDLVLGGVVTTSTNEMYLHEYEFIEKEGKVLLNNIKLIWKH